MGRLVKDTMLAGLAASTPAADVVPYTEEFYGDWQVDAYTAFRKTVALVPGSVVWVEDGAQAVKARVLTVFPDRDREGFRRPKFRIQKATQRDTWSRVWVYCWPGHIERGYQKAGVDTLAEAAARAGDA